MYFKLAGESAGDINCMIGKWAGFNESSDFADGYGVIAEDKGFAERALRFMIENHGRLPKELSYLV